MDGLKARLSFDAVAYDYDDEYLTIDTDTHIININNISRLFGVQYDGNSKLIKLRVRNQLSDIQKMQDSIVYINWIDSKGVKGQSIAINKTINNDTCEFAWKVPFDALKNSGVLHFAVSAVVTKNSSSVIDQRWSTQIASVMTPDGIYIKSYTPSSEEEDRIAQIYNELSKMINKQSDNLNKLEAQVNQLNEGLVELFKFEFKNGLYTVGGNERYETSWKKCINYIPIDFVKEISLPIYEGAAGIAYYDKYLQFVGCEQGTQPLEATIITQLTPPTNAIYFRFCYFNNDADKYKIVLKDMLEKTYLDAVSEKEINDKYGNTVKYASFVANKQASSTVDGYNLAFNKLLRQNSRIRVSQRFKIKGSTVKYFVVSKSYEILKVIDCTSYFAGINTFDLDFSDIHESFYLCLQIPSNEVLYFDNDKSVTNDHAQWQASYFESDNIEIGQTITIKHSLGVKQSYNIGFDVFTTYLDSLNVQDTNKTIYVVDKKGNGDFKTINEAVANAKDSKDNPITILIYPGIYDEVVVSLNRYLSFIGVNKQTCIIRDKSGKYANSPIKISGGEWTLENLTIIANGENAGDWTPTWENFDFPSYAIHVDGGGAGKGFITNCYVYSECLNAIGMGLHNNETVTIENSLIERNTKNSVYLSEYYQGALACHSTTDRTKSEENEHLIVKSCDIISNTDKALQLYSYTAGSPWKTTFELCTLEANGSVDNTVYCRRGEELPRCLTVRCHGNNASELNK